MLVYDLLFLIIGLSILTFSSSRLIPFFKDLAHYWKVPALIVGLTVASIGTSLPEITTSIIGVLSGAPGLSVGNIFGSEIVQITFLLGVVVVASYSGLNVRRLHKVDLGMLVFASLSLAFVTMDGVVSFWDGLISVLIYIGYVIYLFVGRDGHATHDKESVHSPNHGYLKTIAFTAFLMLLVIVGAKLSIDGAIGIAKEFAVSEYIIGLLIVGVGTSLPELAISFQAAVKGEEGLAFGNLIGSNITDPLFSLGVGALVGPMVVSDILIFDSLFFIIVTTIVAGYVWKHRNLPRVFGAFLIGAYALFVLIKLGILELLV
ncbi:MAG: calcium/sodium antiporter [Candidatus Diapherotrites archaeon]|nr:calcium/sodium antiporter [Candidatus Diapherotrites archaeon]